jgi:proline dehydrogenase
LKIKSIRKYFGNILRSFVEKAATSYIAGEKLESAMIIVKKIESLGQNVTLGYFDSSDLDSKSSVVNAYLNSLSAMEKGAHYLSVKLPAVDFDENLIEQVLQKAQSTGSRIHMDALWPESVDQTQKVIINMLGRNYLNLGFTLPGRWKRSISDAEWVCEHSLKARVVKGQWSDLENLGLDPREGFLDVIKILASRNAPLVAVATHDTGLAETSIKILQAANIPCELELLFGLPMTKSLKMAETLQVPVRIYVPFGRGYLPYVAKLAVYNPKITGWLIKDFIGSFFHEKNY